MTGMKQTTALLIKTYWSTGTAWCTDPTKSNPSVNWWHKTLPQTACWGTTWNDKLQDPTRAQATPALFCYLEVKLDNTPMLPTSTAPPQEPLRVGVNAGTAFHLKLAQCPNCPHQKPY